MIRGGYRLGIDFGTSTTVAMIQEPGRPVRPVHFDASPRLPSAVFLGVDGVLLTGEDAERAAPAHPAGFEAHPKRRVDDGTVWLSDHELGVVNLVAAVLDRAVAEAVRVTGTDPSEVVITCPEAWGPARRTILTRAAAHAGLDGALLVTEPVAAATYLVEVVGKALPAGRCLVVYDMGAGTCDVSVVRVTPSGFEVAASGGLDDVGGLDIDDVLVRHLRRAHPDPGWAQLDWPTTLEQRQARQALWRNVREAKEQLSRQVSADVFVPLVDRRLHLTRDELERLARPLLDRTVELTLATLRRAGIPPEDVGAVFPIGGSSRIPLVATLLHRALGVPATAVDDPQLVVAHGGLLHRRVTLTAVDLTIVEGRSDIAEPHDPFGLLDEDGTPMPPSYVPPRPRPSLDPPPHVVVARHLLPTERRRGEWRRHWVHVAGSAVVGAASIPAGIAATAWALGSTGWLITVAVAWFSVLSQTAYRFNEWSRTWLCLTDQRLMLVEGGRNHRSVSLALDRITEIEYEQRRLGQILGYGVLIVEADGRHHQLRRLAHLPNIRELHLRITEQVYQPHAVAARLLEP
ncbi:Hsp70 family protein [Phytohabitans houttuyneae]|uniref:Hsp70 family protein n=1 Tax=Phytohabitans houttuyneae TaxID=1076126 RepID=UPI0015640311|nr:Hsp70 family protein [Phytohabitans houttuyneae]